MNKLEILSPAGSMEALKAAVMGGCDAVYVGGSQFSARAFANNFTQEDLLFALDYVHLHKKSLYLTVNTLLKEEELKKQLYDSIKKPYESGLDAVIVQDVGVLRFLHNCFPDLPLHASTQMTLTGPQAVLLLKSYGVTRIVPSRECSLEEIKEIRKQSDIEIEAFVHGALCYCYSGQCLYSSLIGGRSGNRGRCAQPCRMEYQLKDETKKKLSAPPYLLSPKDICTIELIPELAQAGVSSFKIEGRMKRPEYVAYTAKVYRYYADIYEEYGALGFYEYVKDHPKEQRELEEKLADLYNRGGFSKGYYQVQNGFSMMSMERPNHFGVLAAKVIKLPNKKQPKMQLKAVTKLFAQDILELRKDGKTLYEFTLKEEKREQESFLIPIPSGLELSGKLFVYRTKNNHLLNQITSQLQEPKIPVEGKLKAFLKKPLTLTVLVKNMQEEEITVTVKGEPVFAAKSQPILEERLREAICQTQATPFFFSTLEIEMENDIFIPISQVKELRRRALETLMQKSLSQYHKESQNFCESSFEKEVPSFKEEAFKLLAKVETSSQLSEVLERPEIEAVYLSLSGISDWKQASFYVKQKRKQCYLVLPSVFRKNSEKRFASLQEELLDTNLVDGILVKTMEEAIFAKKIAQAHTLPFEIILDYNMYITNEEARKFWMDFGINGYTASVELTEGELSYLDLSMAELIVYGYLPMMTSAQCIQKNVIGCQKESRLLFLEDRKGIDFPVKNYCKDCYNIIYNSLPLAIYHKKEAIRKKGLKRFRLDFTIETEKQTRQVLEQFFLGQLPERYTTGHFKRGVE